MTDWWAEVTGGSAKAPPPAVEQGTDWWGEVTRPSLTATGPNAPIDVPGKIIDDPLQAASMGVQFMANLPTAMKDKIRVYARARFPAMATNDAMSRYGWDEEGRIFFRDTDGKVKYETTEFSAPWGKPSADAARAMEGNWKALAAGGPGGAPVATGTGAGVAMTKLGATRAIPGVGGVAMATDVARQALAAGLTGEEKPLAARAMQTLGVGLQEGGGQALGHMGAAGLARFGKMPAYDLSPSEAHTAEGFGHFGIRGTPGEKFNNPDLIRRQQLVGDTTGARPIVAENYAARNVEVERAVYEQLNRMSGETSVYNAAVKGSAGAKAAAEHARKQLQKEAKPFYDEAEKVNDVDTMPVIELIDEKLATVSPPVASLLKRFRASLVRKSKVDGKDMEYAEHRLGSIDEVKKWMDTEYAKAASRESSIGSAQAHHIKEVRALLVQQADEASDAAGGYYRKARNIYEEGVGPVGEIEKGVVGYVGRLEAHRRLTAARTILSPRTSSPELVAQARDAYAAAGKQKEWAAMVRAYAQELFEDIPRTAASGATTNLGGTYRKAILGTPRKQAMLAEAFRGMPGNPGPNFLWLMDVLEASGRAMKGESWTAIAQAGQKELAAEAKPILAAGLETIEVWRTPSRIANWWSDAATGRYAARWAELLFAPDAVNRIAELRKLSPRSAGAIVGVAHLSTAKGLEEIDKWLFPLKAQKIKEKK